MSVVRVSVRDQILNALTERILSGAYQPGERLVELRIAREFSASQGSVREALRELEASRLVESTPHRGTRVRVVSPREMREAYLVRGVLEQAAAAGAARKFKGGVAPLRIEVAALLAAAERGATAEQAAHVYAFHHQIVAASENSVLLRLWESLAFEVRIRVRIALGDIAMATVAASYERIVAALDRGDARTAGRWLKAHAEAYAPPAGGDDE